MADVWRLWYGASMRHVGFLFLLFIALFFAMFSALPWAMNECQMHADQETIDLCFNAAQRVKLIWSLTIGLSLIASIVLHIFKSRWMFGRLSP